ncbi:MAG: winged helix-turn-helix domain-containing protein, partial [Anaerolineales bacterium]
WVPAEASQERIVRGDIIADLQQHHVTIQGKSLELTPTEFNLLVYMMENSGRVLPHQAILQHVWGPEYGAESEYLRVYIGRLRQKVENDPGQPRHLITERGIGYRFQD